MGLGQLFQTEKVELYPEETKKMKIFLNNLKIQDYCFTKEISNDRVYELLKKYMKKELITFFESNKSKAIEEFNYNIKEKYLDFNFDEFVSQVIKIEGGNEICMNKIYDEIILLIIIYKYNSFEKYFLFFSINSIRIPLIIFF